jgi:hypothetical protein
MAKIWVEASWNIFEVFYAFVGLYEESFLPSEDCGRSKLKGGMEMIVGYYAGFNDVDGLGCHGQAEAPTLSMPLELPYDRRIFY